LERLEFDGANPLRSVVSPHAPAVDEAGRYPFVDFVDLETDHAKRILKRRGIGASFGTVGAAVLAIHEFEYVNPTTGITTLYQFVATAGAIYLWNSGTNAFDLQTLPGAVTAGVTAWSFDNFSNRCFADNGKDPEIMFDPSQSPPWKYTGIDAPTGSLTYTLKGKTTFGRISATNGSPTITITGAPISSLTSIGLTATATTPTPHNLTAGETVQIAGAGVAAYNGAFVVATVPSSTTFTYAFAGGVSPAVGTITGFRHWPTGAVWVTPELDINGNRYTLSTVDAFNTGTLTEPFKEPTATGLTFAVYVGVMAWDEPPFYTYAYQNPTSGHVSEAGPVLQITEKDQTGATPVIVIPGSAQNTTAYNAGYTKILIFRSPQNGSMLRQINTLLNNNNAGTSITFQEDATTGRNTALLDIPAPIAETNKKPPTAMTVITSAMGRRFGLRPSDPTNTPPEVARVYFSALAEELKLGRPEESWPRRFSRHGVPKPTGLLSLGGDGSTSGLLILATDGIYSIDGYDNVTFTPPYRIAARRSGAFQGGAVDVRGELVVLYRDKRLFQAGRDVGGYIQDKLNAISAASIKNSRAYWHAYEEDDVLLVTYPTGGSVNNRTLVVDYDNERINEWLIGYTAIGTCHNASDATELWIGTSTGAVYRLLQDVWQDSGSNFTPRFRTAPIRRDMRHIAHRIEVFVGPAASNPQSLSWTLNYRIDEDTVGTNVTLSAVPGDRQSAQGRALVFEFERPVVWNSIDFQLTFPASATQLYVEKMVVYISPEQDVPENK
jgi:hypothetical protein